MEWSPTSGEGTIFAELVVENVMDPAYRAEVPYVLVLVETDEGPLIPSRLVGADVREDHIGHRARVRYLDVPESGVTFPLFELS
jgi:uncharacterized OB-fold protein